MKLIKKSILIIFIIIFLVFWGYFRDFLFKKINSLLQAWDHDFDYEMPGLMKFITNFEYDTIVIFKWILTFVFWGIYLLMSVIVIKLFFTNKQFIKITIAAFITILMISGTFMMIGSLFTSASEKMYEFSRYLMGMAQSPIVLMILIPVFKLYEKGNKETVNKQ